MTTPTRKNMNLHFCDENYCVFPPSEVNDIVKEGNELQHDAGSTGYISGILKGRYLIVFMRRNDDPLAPLVTLEVRDGKVHLSAGKANRAPTREEAEFIEKYNEHLASGLDGLQYEEKVSSFLRAAHMVKELEARPDMHLFHEGKEVDRNDRPQIFKTVALDRWTLIHDSLIAIT
jgi:hypothetical protein